VLTSEAQAAGRTTAMTTLEVLREDARFFGELRRPGQAPTWLSLARVALGSRGFWTVATQRVTAAYLQWKPSGPLGRALRLFAKVLLNLGAQLVVVAAKSEAGTKTAMEPGVYLSDRGHVILGARGVGTGTLIHHHVTIGRGLGEGIPEIGRRVWIGPHCVIFGAIKVGDGATVLPGTVLSMSVPAGAVAQGNPARLVMRSFDNSALRSGLGTEVELPLGGPGPRKA